MDWTTKMSPKIKTLIRFVYICKRCLWVVTVLRVEKVYSQKIAFI